VKAKVRILPVLNSRPILYNSPPGAAGNHVVSMINGHSEFQDRHIKTKFETKQIEHEILYHGQNINLYYQQVNNLVASGVKAIATHWSHMLDDSVFGVQATWTNPKLTKIFACRDMMTVQPKSLNDHINQDKKYQLLSKSPISRRKKILGFVTDVINYGETSSNKLHTGWHSFCIDSIFTEPFIDDLAELLEKAGISLNYALAKEQHKNWLEKNPPNDFTVRRAVRRLEKFIL
jgi:hypothetical protein